MRKVSKILSMLIVLTFVLPTLLIGCSKEKATQEETKNTTSTKQTPTTTPVEVLKEAELTIYLVGDAQEDAGLVYDEVNKLLKEELNATVKMKYMPWADWQQKYNLVFASGEAFDGIYTGTWTGYIDQATKGGFMELTEDMIKEYAPDYYKLIMEKAPRALEETKVDGKIFMLPAYDMWTDAKMVIVRGDLREKYNLPEILTLKDYENYLITVAQNETDFFAYNASTEDMFYDYQQLAYLEPNNLVSPIQDRLLYLAYDMNDPECKIVNILENPEYLDYLKGVKALADAGAIPSDVLTNKTRCTDTWLAGMTASVPSGLATVNGRYGEAETQQPEWKPEVYDINPDAYKKLPAGNATGFAIHAGSENWERLLMTYNLFITQRKYHDLTQVGIEGVHYTLNDGVYVNGPDVNKFQYSNNCPWGWQNMDLLYPSEGRLIRKEFDSKWKESGKAISPALSVFNFIDTEVKNEIAACTNVLQTKGYILSSGKSKNIEGDLERLKEDLKNAGIGKIEAELQRQIDEFLTK